jgi:hypothetical protein
MSGIDWNTELKKLERDFVGLPPAPSAGSVKAKKDADRRAQERLEAAQAKIGAIFRMTLVAALAGSLYFWPYARTCGFGLYAYMAAEALIAAGALWVVTFTWRHRLARAHGVAFVLFIGALVLLAIEVLPRVGYAAVDPAHPARWACVSR